MKLKDELRKEIFQLCVYSTDATPERDCTCIIDSVYADHGCNGTE